MAVNNNSGKQQVSSPIRSGYFFNKMEVTDGKYGSQVAITFNVTKDDGTTSNRLYWLKVPAEDAKEGSVNSFASTINSFAHAMLSESEFNATKDAYFAANPSVENRQYAEWVIGQIMAHPTWDSTELEVLYVYEDKGKEADGTVKFKVDKDKEGNNVIYSGIPSSVFTTGTFIRRKGDASRPMELSKKAQGNVALKDKYLEYYNALQTNVSGSSETW